MAQDGVARNVRNDLQDRFCLDGRKLRLVAGSYGVAGSEYRTELESYARITANGTAGNGPAWFKVERADGLIYEYGNSADSRIESVGQATARAWAVNRIRDRQGNEILFSYAEDTTNGSYRVDLVSYAGNPSLGVAAPYSIDFVYETKPAGEIDSGYLAGSKVKEITRLDRVDVLHGGTTLVRRWELTYEAALSSTGRSRLASVQECAGSPLDCLAPSSFTYQSGSLGLGAEVNTGVPIPAGLQTIDVDGDGRDDLVYSSSPTSGSGTWRVMFANAAGGFSPPVDTGIVNTNYSGAIPIDYNADGKADLLVPYSGNTWWVLLGSSAGLAAPVNTATPVTATGSGGNARGLDLDGDGLQDLVWADLVGYAGGDAIRYRLRLAGGGFSSTVQTLVGPLPVDEKIQGLSFGRFSRPADLNGDGRADLVYRHAMRFSTTQAPPPDTEAEAQAEATDGALAVDGAEAPAAGGYNYVYSINVYCPGAGSFASFSGNAASTPYFGDFNGDGKTDLLYYDNAGYWRYRFSTGLGLTAQQTGPGIAAYGSWVVKDWDGDGYDDVVGPHTASGTWHLMRSTGETLAAPVTTGVPHASGTSGPTALDLNGDGLDDLAWRDINGIWRYRPHSLDTALPDLLSTAQDGFGTTAGFSYLPITNATVYTKGTGAIYPMVDVQVGRWVVSQMTASDGSGHDTTATLGFSYEAARRDLQGRGFLGFAKRTVIDSTLGYNLKSIETYRQDFPYVGALASRERQQSTGTRLAYTANSWAALSYGTGYATRSYPYIASSSTDEHEAGGTQNGVRWRSVVTSVAAVDTTSGLVTDATTTTTERATGLFTSSFRTERIQHTGVLNDTAHWCLGRPTATQVTASHTLANGGAITRSEDASWDGPNCRPTQQRLEPGHPTLQVTVGLGYDGFGNLASRSVTGAAMAARTTGFNWGSDGRFLTTITDPLGKVTTQAWHAASGLPASVTDPNILTVSWSYDAFGRRTLESRPDLTSTLWAYGTCSSCETRIRQQVTQTERDDTGSPYRTVTRYLDRYDRLAWEQVPLLTPTETSWSVRREYDARGRVVKEYVPYLTSGAHAGYRLLTYDLLDRPTSEALYDASGALNRTTGLAYAGLAATVTDPLNHATTRVQNAWGELVRVTDAAAGQTNYQSDAFGLLKQVSDASGNVVSQVTYNLRGMRTQLSDVDLGTWSFTPNALGELISQTDAKGQATSFAYDALGRLTTRIEAEGTSTWTWGSSAVDRNIGRLQSVAGPGYSESYLYDDFAGRLTRHTITADASYQYDYAYNGLGQLHTLTWPTSTAGVRFKARYGYASGQLTSVQDYTGDVNGPQLWGVNLLDASGRAVSESYGNGLWVQNGFHALTGEAVTRKAGTGGAETNIQHLVYSWDTTGNLASRQDLRQGLTETFSYDALDRLTSTTGPGGTLTLAYDAIGNITSRSDVGSYTYHASKKHAVVTAGSNSYGYDANGNLTTRNGTSITWTSANLPATLNAAGYSATFSYTPDRARWRQVSTYAGGNETTIYVGGMLEKLTTAVRTHWKHLIPTPSGQVQVIRRSDGTSETLYLTTDHLGSTEAVLNTAGTVLARTSFAAWGARRGSNWQGVPSQPEWQAIADTTRRGYTGHEHLDNVMLVHMNGRVYDAAIGRFLSADPFVDGAEGSQGWNRYGYVKNMPLAFTDPSGFSAEPPSAPILPIEPPPTVIVEASRLRDPRNDLPRDPSEGMRLMLLRQMLDAPSVTGYTAEGLEEITVTGQRPPPPRRRGGTKHLQAPPGPMPRSLTECENGTLRPYIPDEDLANARLYDGVVPGYLPDDYIGITRGNRIYFRPGVYTPRTASGLALLGHELIHVGQYREGATWLSFISSYARHGYENSPLEVSARQIENRIRNDLQRSGKTCGGGVP